MRPLPTAADLRKLLHDGAAHGLSAGACRRLEWILHFAATGRSATATCAASGISRSTFHRWLGRFDPSAPGTLEDRSHEPLCPRPPAAPDEVVDLIRRYRVRYPRMGKGRIADVLRLDHGVPLSASTVGRIIERECLYFGDTPRHREKRLLHDRRQRRGGPGPACPPATGTSTGASRDDSAGSAPGTGATGSSAT